MENANNIIGSFEKDFYEYSKLNKQFFEKYSQIGIAGREWDSLDLDNKDPKTSYYFYLTSPSYFLAIVRLQLKRKLFRLDFYEKYANGSILDFGAGIGGEAFYFASKGVDITYYEPNAIARDFMRFRAKKHNVSINILEPWEFKTSVKKFDTIFCFDVFDHIPNWRNLIPVFKSKLNKDGVLVHQTKFGHEQEKCPYHFNDSVETINKALVKHKIKYIQIPSV